MRLFFKPLAACLLLAGSVHAADWNQWRGANRDGVDHNSPALIKELPAEGLKPLWISEPIPSARSGGWGSPVIANDVVYLFAHIKEKVGEAPKKKYPYLSPEKRVGMTQAEYAEYERKRRDEDELIAKAYAFREVVYAISSKTGKTIWTNKSESVYTRFPQSGSPIVLDGRLYFLGAGRHARCIDAKTGDNIWKTPLPGEFRDEFYQASIAIADGVALVMATTLFGLDCESGDIIWEGDENATKGSHSSPVVWTHQDKNFGIVNTNGGNTICFVPKTGEILWTAKTESGRATPIIVGDRLITYGSSRKQGMRCFEMSPSGATEHWKFQGTADKGSSPVVFNGNVFVQGEKRLACVSLEDGTPQWQTTLDLAKPQYTSLIAAGGRVFYAYKGLLVFEATGDEFKPLIDAKMDESKLLGTEKLFRKKLGLDEIEKEDNGLEKAMRLYQKAIGKHGPLECATPAISDGKIYMRLKDSVACYDLSA